MPIYINEDKYYESLNEVKILRKNGLCIIVEGEGRVGHEWYKDPYFKVYHAESREAAKYMSRIYFARAEYVKDHGKADAIPKELDRNQLKNLIKILTPDIWEKMNEVRVTLSKQQAPKENWNLIPKTYDMPDYSNLR